MPPKKSKKKAKKPKTPVIPSMKNTVRTFYELEIEDIKKKIASRQGVSEIKFQLESEIAYLIENREDPLSQRDAFLTTEKKRMEERHELFEEFKVELNVYIENHNKIVEEKKIEFETKEKTYDNEVNRLNEELEKLQDFKKNREKIVEKCNEMEKLYLEKQELHRAGLRKMDADLVNYKNSVKQDVDRQLLKLSVNFVKGCEQSVPAHTLRLIRENIAFHNEMDRIHRTNQVLTQSLLVSSNYDIKKIYEENKKIVSEVNKKVQIIEETTLKYDKMNKKKVAVEKRHPDFIDTETRLKNEMQHYDMTFHEFTLLKQKVRKIAMDRFNLKHELSYAIRKNKKLIGIRNQLNYHLAMVNSFENSYDTLLCDFDEENFQKKTLENLQKDILELIKNSEEDVPHGSVSTLGSITDVYAKPDYGGLLDAREFDLTEHESKETKTPMRRKSRRQTRQVAEISDEESQIPEQTEKLITSPPETLFDIETDSTEFYFEDSEIELSEKEEEEGMDEGDFAYSSSDDDK